MPLIRYYSPGIRGMDIITALTDETNAELIPLFDRLNCSTQVVQHEDALHSIIEDTRFAGIFLFEWAYGSIDYQQFLAGLNRHVTELPYYAFFIGEPNDYKELCYSLTYGAHDFFLKPLDQLLIEHKLILASQIVTDKQAQVDSNAVLERYAEHVDKLAAERASQLFHAERLSTIGTMSAGLAHEIKTPLGYISASLETAKIYWEQTTPVLRESIDDLRNDRQSIEKAVAKIPQALDRIHLGLDKIGRITSSLQSFARASRGERTETDLNSCVEMALEIAEATTKGAAEIELALEEVLPLVSIDHLQIEQVIINLVVNACHALENTPQPKIVVTTTYDKDRVSVSIADNGPGIPKEKWETIWQPFYTTKEEGKGTGLGLAISKGLIRDNGGTILLDESEFGGAKFELAFPPSS